MFVFISSSPGTTVHVTRSISYFIWCSVSVSSLPWLKECIPNSTKVSNADLNNNVSFSLPGQEADTDPTGEAVHRTQQTLTFYELDLGLNHVVRKYHEPLEEHANFLISVPGGCGCT